MEQQGDQLRVVDQESGRTWLEVPRSTHDLPIEVYNLFEQQPDVREALFFDEGHPDAEGYALMADTVADFLVARGIKNPGPATRGPAPPELQPSADSPPG